MFCTKCGTKNEDNNVFCKNCGAKLVADNTESQSVAGNSGVANAHNSMKIKMIAGVAVAAVVIVGGLLFWKKESNSKVINTIAAQKEEAASALNHEISEQELDESNSISDSDKDTSSDLEETNTTQATYTYVPGIYSSVLPFGNNTNVELQITVDKNCISSINIPDLDESITTVYPLLLPTLNELSEIIISQQSIENISYRDENSYTSMVLMQAISETLAIPRVDDEEIFERKGSEEESNSKLGDLVFTVLGEEQQPDSFKEIIADKSAQPFQISYTLGEELYIAVGYGEQPSGGYSICVNEFYETKDAIVIDTVLISPDAAKSKNVPYIPTRPYIMLKTENIEDKMIEFK